MTYINDNSPNIANFNSVNFRQILEIELMESSKENVLNTIEEIIKIEGVLSAEPNYYVEIDKEPISANEPEEGDIYGKGIENYGGDISVIGDVDSRFRRIIPW